jgi:hypothetical protein
MHRLALALALGALVACGAARQASAAEVSSDDLFPHARGGRVVFSFVAPRDASVFLLGDFNGWDERATPLEYAADDLWEVVVELEPGEHEYKFLVDGRRKLDPSNPDEVEGASGGVDSRIRVLRNGQVSERSHWERPLGRRNEWSPPHGSMQALSVAADLSFNRVDGTTFWVQPVYRTHYDWAPELRTSFGYGWESKRVNVEADFAQPIAPNRMLFLGVHWTDGTGFDNQSEIGRGENTLAGYFLKLDFNDYYEVQAIEPYVRLHLPLRTTLRASYASEDYKSLTTQTDWSFFSSGSDRFRPNPHLFLLGDPDGHGGDGTLQATRLELVHDSRTGRHAVPAGFYTRGFVELGQGDFDYARWIGDARAYIRLGRPVHLAARLRGGSRFDGRAIPSQKLFYVGGLGSVRGHEFRALYGDRELLGNIEYTFLSSQLNAGAMLFYDMGSAWDSRRETLESAKLLQSVGFGFKSANDDFQIDFAKPVGEVKGGIETSVRLNRTF